MQVRYKKTIGIVGGKGKTGSQFARFFRGLGFKVLISDLDTKLTNDELVERSDLVVFSVPLHLSEKIISEEVGKCRRKDQIILDVSSLKQNQVKAMNKAKGQVIGMHPLFGPSKTTFEGLSMVLCPGRCRKKVLAEVRGIFEDAGMKINVMKPAEHDKLMAVVQVIPHLKTILAGELLREFGVNPKVPYDISTPIYKLELDIIGRIFSQDGMLYSAIIAQNPYSNKLVKILKNIVKGYERDVRKQDLKKLDARFQNVKGFLGEFSDEAFRDSERIINEMQKWK
jgi:prephenate dehydrogenase